MFKKIVTTLSSLFIGAGIILILGTAGSSDLDLIDFYTVLVRSSIGVALVWIGFKGLKFTYPVFFQSKKY